MWQTQVKLSLEDALKPFWKSCYFFFSPELNPFNKWSSWSLERFLVQILLNCIGILTINFHSFLPNWNTIYTQSKQFSACMFQQYLATYSWRENGDIQFSITELCFPIRRENVQMTAIIIRTEAHLIREGGHNIHETHTQMLFLQHALLSFRTEKEKMNSCLMPLLWNKFWVGPISNEDKMYFCPRSQT